MCSSVLMKLCMSRNELSSQRGLRCLCDCISVLSAKKFEELSKKRRDELMSAVEMLDEVLLEPYIMDANMRLLVRKVTVHENEVGSLDVNLEFNGDFKETSTGCFEIND